MRVMLTGATGFVGRYVRQLIPCESLEDDGERVDMRDARAVASAVARIEPEAVIHLAAQSFVPASFDDPKTTFDINFYGTFHLLSALKSIGFAGRMVYVGSGDVYGLVPEDALPVRESTPLRPRNPYAVSKVAAEALCYQWSQTQQFEVVMARPFNHIGPGQSERFAVSDFARQVVQIRRGLRQPVLHVGDIGVTRDFTDVRDVVRAYESMLHRGVQGTAYNVCSGTERELRAIIRRLCELAGVRISMVQVEDRMRPAEQRRICGSADLLYRDTDWKPEIPLDKSLADLLDYWEKNGQ